DVAAIIIRHAVAGLPCGLRKIGALPTAARSKRPAGTRVIPYRLGKIGKSRAVERCIRVAPGVWIFEKFTSSQGCNIRQTCRHIDGQASPRRCYTPAPVTIRRPAVAGGRKNRYSLRIRLLAEGNENIGFLAAVILFAVAIADAHDWREILIDGV